MNAPLQIRTVRVHRLAIPLRVKFQHAAATRDTADPIIVELVAGSPYAHHVGYGETLARPYVTGETVDSVIDDLARLFAPRLMEFRPSSFVEALEFIEDLPTEHEGRVITAARAAVELALLDLACRVFRRRPADIAGWMGLVGFGAPGCLPHVRYSGMVVGSTRGKLRTMLWLQRLYGLRDFKLKVAVDGWETRLAWAHEYLSRPMAAGGVTLRVDANAGWTLVEATEALPTLQKHAVCALEQPLSDAQDDDLAYLAEQSPCEIIADESLLTLEDAERLVSTGGVQVFNVRIAKNGGLMPALRIARTAIAAGLDVQLGCLVGETSILSAAGVAFLEMCPKVRFVEGAFGGWLLRGDVSARPVQFGRGGRIRPLRGPGLGVSVIPEKIRALSAGEARTLPLS